MEGSEPESAAGDLERWAAIYNIHENLTALFVIGGHMIFPEPEEFNFKEMLKDDAKKWVSRIELIFEKNTVAHILVKAIVFIIAVIGALVDTLEFSREYWPPFASKIVLLSVIGLILITDFSHVILAKRRLVALNRTKRLVNNIVKIIRGATDLQSTPYIILDWQVEHDINEKGNVRYKRLMKIGQQDGTVYWVKVPIGVIDGNSEDRADDLGIEVVNPVDGGRLPWAVIEETDQRKVIAVMLEPPATLGVASSFCLTLTWRGAYIPLIQEAQDKGKITVEHPTNHIQVTFIAPHGLEFTSLRMKKDIGKSEIQNQEDGRSILIWSADNLSEGEYPYTLVCKRKEP